MIFLLQKKENFGERKSKKANSNNANVKICANNSNKRYLKKETVI